MGRRLGKEKIFQEIAIIILVWSISSNSGPLFLGFRIFLKSSIGFRYSAFPPEEFLLGNFFRLSSFCQLFRYGIGCFTEYQMTLGYRRAKIEGILL